MSIELTGRQADALNRLGRRSRAILRASDEIKTLDDEITQLNIRRGRLAASRAALEKSLESDLKIAQKIDTALPTNPGGPS